jgi:hypothetical protein
MESKAFSWTTGAPPDWQRKCEVHREISFAAWAGDPMRRVTSIR